MIILIATEANVSCMSMSIRAICWEAFLKLEMTVHDMHPNSYQAINTMSPVMVYKGLSKKDSENQVCSSVAVHVMFPWKSSESRIMNHSHCNPVSTL